MESIFICLNIVQIGQGLAINKRVGHVHPLKTRKAQGRSQVTYARLFTEKFSTRAK